MGTFKDSIYKTPKNPGGGESGRERRGSGEDSSRARTARVLGRGEGEAGEQKERRSRRSIAIRGFSKAWISVLLKL